MRVIFLGTPDFAVSSLEALIKSKHEVVAVVTQKDKPTGREAVLTSSPVKQCALKNNILVLQYDKISKEGIIDLIGLKPDIMVTCAFGQILSKEVLDIARFGVINVHASLLPKLRGASPIQHAIINGDKTTGVTIMQTQVGLDCGDIILSEEIEISDDETSSQLFDNLAPLGARLVVQALDKIETGEAVFTPQDDSGATFVKQIKKPDGEIDFSKSARQLDCFVRGMQDWPCAFTYLNGKILKIYSLKKIEFNCENNSLKFGEVAEIDREYAIVVRCGGGFVKILELQAEGGKRMASKDFVLGRKIRVGDILGKC